MKNARAMRPFLYAKEGGGNPAAEQHPAPLLPTATSFSAVCHTSRSAYSACGVQTQTLIPPASRHVAAR